MKRNFQCHRFDNRIPYSVRRLKRVVSQTARSGAGKVGGVRKNRPPVFRETADRVRTSPSWWAIRISRLVTIQAVARRLENVPILVMGSSIGTLLLARHSSCTTSTQPNYFSNITSHHAEEPLTFGTESIPAMEMERTGLPPPDKHSHLQDQAIGALYEIPLPPIVEGLGTLKLPDWARRGFRACGLLDRQGVGNEHSSCAGQIAHHRWRVRGDEVPRHWIRRRHG
jgi:hypothetical protein